MFAAGAECWLADSSVGWVPCVVVACPGGSAVTVQLCDDGSEITVDGSELEMRCGGAVASGGDLTALPHLNEPAVLHSIGERFSRKVIYTYSGIVLVATNPFANVDGLYDSRVMQEYAQLGAGENAAGANLPPHLFAIAQNAHSRMVADHRNQTIIVSGESGAGKTVSAKYLMRYLAELQPQGVTNGSLAASTVEDKILATNPIMEAFGNAKTTRNDNSSRFGKYLAISFDSNLKIVGATIETYLLEKSRLVTHPVGERNYHVFYQMLEGLGQGIKERLHLTTADAYNYLNQGGPEHIRIDNVDDSAEFTETCKSLQKIGITEEKQEQLFQILSGILHLGNIQINKGRGDLNASVSLSDPHLMIASELLGINSAEFAKWITKRQLVTRSERINSNLNHSQALVVRDSAAKFIYTALFDWLVTNINKQLQNMLPEQAKHTAHSFIGILDIYGFEHFERNSFEQFCINYANEKLQQEFNQHVFKLEQEEYVKEKIEWSFIQFNDNQPCIDLIENKLGILSLLDEESRLPAGSDESWTSKLYQTFNVPPLNEVFSKPKFGQSKFIVSHYAHDVSYDIEGFIEKNKDSVSENHMDVLKSTTNETLRGLLDNLEQMQLEMEIKKKEADAEKSGGKAISQLRMIQRKPTLGSIFKQSLINLMSTINSTDVHYIRCIKPNSEKKPWMFDNLMVLSQLRACGVLETIKISCAGFPSRWTFKEFVARYYFLVDYAVWLPYMTDGEEEQRNLLELIQQILTTTIDDDMTYQIGKTKIFFKAGMLAFLEGIRNAKLAALSVKIQKKIRAKKTRVWYLDTTTAISKTQNLVRCNLVREVIQRKLRIRAAVFIQSNMRGWKCRLEYKVTVCSLITLQSYLRGKLSKLEMIRVLQGKSAVLIQKRIRRCLAINDFLDLRRFTVCIQSHVRSKHARLLYEKLKGVSQIQHSAEAELTKKLLDVMGDLSSKIKENKANCDFVKDLQQNEVFKAILSKDEAYAELCEELDNVGEALKQRQTEVERMATIYRQNQDLTKSALSRFDDINSLSSTKFTGSLEARLNSLQEEVNTIKAAFQMQSLSVDGRQDTDEVVGLGISINEVKRKTVTHNKDSAMSVNVKLLVEEVTTNLLKGYQVPRTAKSCNETIITYPAQVIITLLNLFVTKGFCLDMDVFVSETFSTIQDIVKNLPQDKTAIHDGLFWINNVCHVYSYAQTVAEKGAATTKLRDDCEDLLVTVFDSWMKCITSLMRYDVNVSGALLGSPSNFFREDSPADDTTGNVPIAEKKLTHLLVFLYSVDNAAQLYEVDRVTVNCVFAQILGFINSLCFNDLCVKFYGLSWKLGKHLDNNIRGLDEWLHKHDIELPLLDCLPHLRQVANLLQLRVATVSDLTVVNQLCFLLNPIQLQTLLKKYQHGRAEPAVPGEVFTHLTQLVKNERYGSALTLQMGPRGVDALQSVTAAGHDPQTQLIELLDEYPMPHTAKLLQA
ncbi:uncharacterized protein KNAG_0D04910 [Huiozyma naganishii CBS 8797]|uniref:Myosin motor domain-containing protein n=1 Tax=Huiozyma naganishii (strain ATCC MYA-139 / BCRC 22969 / CBS 8797 / KCTC 17520 / NBRC 10181 / NCYC 3082 / Yp74L-3) TaxID=1071383 RepID=J7R5U3_HUIN7|nr:hypothetical protein KNAG_0D04910 [Kazachstania naganishii CBS 8797]CCK70230.1 hypothetical protein KNAG_0D04910 [Kazachstania naganishii CBS 8797]